jgi:hypothetical protein
MGGVEPEGGEVELLDLHGHVARVGERKEGGGEYSVTECFIFWRAKEGAAGGCGLS